MPDSVNAKSYAADRPQSRAPEINPDRVGEELADDARIWRVYDRIAKEDDETRISHWNRGLDNLALFAGLFSAVTTTFIVEAQNDMKPDYVQLTFQVLNATSFQQPFVPEPFAVPLATRTVNCLWVSSLFLSLTAALIAIMGKDWIGMYAVRPDCNLRQWAEMRTYRLRCVERWYMSGVIAAAPVLLHVSLLLFGAGLAVFISSDRVTHYLTIGLCLATSVLYLITTLSAVIFSASPFKSPASQMIRTALFAFSTSIYFLIYRPKRGLVSSLLKQVNIMAVGRADDSAFLPGWIPDRRPAAILAAAGNAAAAFLQSIPTSLCTAYERFNLSCTKSRLCSFVSSFRRLQLGSDWFFSSTWTDLPADRRPNLLAEALSWLNGASQAPDVFRAIVFALGDLDVGPQVGKHTSVALATRLRAEIRRTWRHVDFLTLSRYVLADRNTAGDPELDHYQFTGRFDLSAGSPLRCEDGLAAVIRINHRFISPGNFMCYSPDQVAQPRMPQFLMPYIRQILHFRADVLILLLNRYETHLWKTNAFTIKTLEVHLYQSLDVPTRDAYTTAVTVKYGGTAGAIELLTFLCCSRVISSDTRSAAVELILKLLDGLSTQEHRCLAYLFGSSSLWSATWKDKNWSYAQLDNLTQSLEFSCQHPFQPSSVRTQSDDGHFDLALARTVITILSPKHNHSLGLTLERGSSWIKFLSGHLCHYPSPSILGDNEKLAVIRLILEGASLVTVGGMAPHFGYDDDVGSWSTAILAAIISALGRCLCDPATSREAEQLFAAMVRTKVKGKDGDPVTWDLGEWIRTQAPAILKNCPSSTAAITAQGPFQGISRYLFERRTYSNMNFSHPTN